MTLPSPCRLFSLFVAVGLAFPCSHVVSVPVCVTLCTSGFWQGCISSLGVLLGGVGDSQGMSEYINSHQKANRAEWRQGALSCEWHWAAVWVYHHSITACISSGITHTRRKTQHTRRGAPRQFQRACTHVHCNASASCHWQVKCNQSLFLFVLSFLTPLLLSALVSGFHGALCSIDPDSALIACPSKWNYLDIDIVECSAVLLGCNWWRTALTERPKTISMMNMCDWLSAFIFGDFNK